MPINVGTKISEYQHVMKVGVNYKFGGPVMAASKTDLQTSEASGELDFPARGLVLF